MGFDIDLDLYICKFTQKVSINGTEGRYFGEIDMRNNLPSGRGFFYANEKDAWSHLGYFSGGKLADGRRISFNCATRELRISQFWTLDNIEYERGTRILKKKASERETGIWMNGLK